MCFNDRKVCANYNSISFNKIIEGNRTLHALVSEMVRKYIGHCLRSETLIIELDEKQLNNLSLQWRVWELNISNTGDKKRFISIDPKTKTAVSE